MKQDSRPAATMIDISAGSALDVARLERALGLQGEPLGDGRYHIVGGDAEHWVDLYGHPHPHCDCGDYLWRERICKHILAALMREGNEQVIRAVGNLFAAMKQAAPDSTLREFAA